MKPIIAAFAAAIAMPLPAAAQDASTQAIAEDPLASRTADAFAVLKDEKDAEGVFTVEFLAQISASQLHELAARLESEFGDLKGVESVDPRSATAAVFEMRFEKAIGRGNIMIDPEQDDRISLIEFTDFEPIESDPSTIADDLSALGGETGLLVARLEDSGDITPLLDINGEQQLAIGSTFKLYVLSAVARAVAEGRHRWDEVVPLSQSTFAGSQLNAFPENAPMTVQTLASFMISVSDNRATDQLIALVGREAVEAEVLASSHADPELILPFLTTAELFALKASSDEKLADYAAADDSDQRVVLEALDLSGVANGDVNAIFANGPRALEVEWFASGYDIARIFQQLDGFDDPTVDAVLGINPAMGPADRAQWRTVAYKGGSEPGVLNFSWLLSDAEGRRYVVSIGRNDPTTTFGDTDLMLLAQRAIRVARDQ